MKQIGYSAFMGIMRRARPVRRSCEHDDETSGLIKSGEIFNQLSEYHLLENGSSHCSEFFFSKHLTFAFLS
jgi:hypothetical protein